MYKSLQSMIISARSQLEGTGCNLSFSSESRGTRMLQVLFNGTSSAGRTSSGCKSWINPPVSPEPVQAHQITWG